MKIFAFFGLSVLVGATVLPTENRAQANAFLKRDKREKRVYHTGESWRDGENYCHCHGHSCHCHAIRVINE